MQKLTLLATIFFLFGCAKENIALVPSGTWTIVETAAGTGTSVQLQTYSPTSEITLEFAPGGRLVLTGANPGQAMSPLWEYDRYEIQADNIIRFFHTNGSREMKAYLTLNNELYLNYLWARCGYEEKFVKVK